MAVPDANTVLAKWKQRASAAASDYAEGVANTQSDPAQLAIAAGPRYIQRVQEAFNSGAWANGLRRSGKQGWQAAVASKGVSNYGTGVNNADAKFLDAFQPLLAYIGNAQSQVASMPNVTDADRKARMNRMFDLMIQYRR